MTFFDAAQSLFAQATPGLPPALVDAARSHLDAAVARGLPQKSDEAWRQTDLGFLARAEFAAADPAPDAAVDAALDAACAGLAPAARAVFVDGAFDAGRSSLGAGGPVRVRARGALLADGETPPPPVDPAPADHAGDGFGGRLARGLGFDGAVVEVGPGAAGDDDPPLVQLIFVDTGRAPLTAGQNHIRLLPGARAALVETFVCAGDAGGVRAIETDVVVEKGARLSHHAWHLSGPGATSFVATNARVHAGGAYAHLNLGRGGRLVRSDLDVALIGPGARLRSDGLLVLDDDAHFDVHSRLRHLAPETESAQLYKGVLAGRSHGVFHGLVRVEKDAQKIVAEQASHHLLLSEDAAIDTNPQLEIFADDVKCAHGSTVGQLDEGAVFYCTSRGIPEDEARALLTCAFAAEVIERQDPGPLKDALYAHLGAALDHNGDADARASEESP